jgi:hypothetical protein
MKNIFFMITLLILAACSQETELRSSIFLPDRDALPLPQYSEWGYNTFGAFYERQAFVSNGIPIPAKVINDKGLTSLVFTGVRGVGENYYYVYGEQFIMTISLSNFDPSSYNDLISLHNVTFDLTSPGNRVALQGGDSIYEVEVLEGKFEVKHAQNLLVDNESEEVILSGVFEFKALVDGAPTAISNGRFDVGIGNFNFYKY